MGCIDKNGPMFWDNFKGSKYEQMRQVFMMKKQDFNNIPLLKFNQGIRTIVEDALKNQQYKHSFLVQMLKY